MGLLSLIGGIASTLFGGGSGGGNQAIVSEAMEKILPETAKEKEAAAIASEDEDIKDVDSARAYDPKDMPVIVYQPGMGIIPFFLLWILDLIGHIVDTVNHALRPAMMIWIIGGFMKKWPLPIPSEIDPQLWTVFMIMVTFWFGARTLVKDVPAAFAAFKNLRK